MQKSKIPLAVIGFLLAGTGILAIFLSLVGIDFTILYWLKSFGPMLAFTAKIGMVMLGFILIYFGVTDLSKEEI